MKTIILEPLQVNGKLHIAIRFTYDAELVGLMHEIPGCKWSPSRPQPAASPAARTIVSSRKSFIGASLS